MQTIRTEPGIRAPVSVETEEGVPAVVTLPGARALRVAVVDFWRETGRYWEGEAEADFFRVEIRDRDHRGQFILYREVGTEAWRFYRAFD
jgi:hypothetical protein